ncbi:MAG: HEAT repeat domain-containing protein [Planctomycetota bacterium]
MQDPDVLVRRNAIVSIFENPDTSAFPLVQKALEDRGPGVRLGTAMALSKLPVCASKAAETLLRIVDKDGVSDAPFVPRGLELHRTRAEDVTGLVHAMVGRASNVPLAVTPEASSVREPVKVALVASGVEGLSSLLKFIEKRGASSSQRKHNYSELEVVTAVIVDVCGEEAREALERGLASRHEAVRSAALIGLTALAKHASSMTPQLAEMVSSKTVALRWRAVEALGATASDDAATLARQLVEPWLSDDVPLVRTRAAYALFQVTGEADPGAELLASMLDDKAAEVRLAAIWSLGRIGTKSEAVLPALIGVLKRSDPQDLREAEHSLEVIGPPAQEAVPALEVLLTHPNVSVRLGAEFALGSIRRR